MKHEETKENEGGAEKELNTEELGEVDGGKIAFRYATTTDGRNDPPPPPTVNRTVRL